MFSLAFSDRSVTRLEPKDDRVRNGKVNDGKTGGRNDRNANNVNVIGHPTFLGHFTHSYSRVWWRSEMDAVPLANAEYGKGSIVNTHPCEWKGFLFPFPTVICFEEEGEKSLSKKLLRPRDILSSEFLSSTQISNEKSGPYRNQWPIVRSLPILDTQMGSRNCQSSTNNRARCGRVDG